MARVEPAVQSGSLLKLYQALWAPYYQAVLSILGSTGVILPIGDPHHGQPNATSFTTKGGEQLTCTWSEPPSAFDAPLDLADPDSFQGIVPVVDLNGTDEVATSPDTTYWSNGDGANDNAFSIGFWANFPASAATHTPIAKYAGAGALREWRLRVTDDELLQLLCTDHSANVSVRRDTNAAVATGRWVFLVCAYDGSGGAGAMDGVAMYEDGVAVASTATNNASYVAMENGSQKLSVFHEQDGVPADISFFDGKTAGGPLGIFHTKKALSADEVRALYDLGRAALAL